MTLSVTVPLQKAINRTTTITFRPFDFGKWFVLGFVAWLANLGQGGGGGGANFGTPGRRGGSAAASGPSGGGPVGQWIGGHLPAVIVLAVLAVAILITVVLVVTRLRSRAKFMFLDNLAANAAAVREPWRRYRVLGNSLFAFTILLTVVSLLAYAVIGGVGASVAWPDIETRRFSVHAIVAIALGICLLLPTMLAFALVYWCTNNFVVPLMYLRNQTVVPAWREFRTALLPGHVGSIVLFLLMQLVLRIAIAAIGVVAGCVTCCIGFLPYIGTVLTLPLYVFDQCYPVYFLEQFGPGYRIFPDLPDAAGGFPVIPLAPPYPPPPAS